MNIIMPEAGEKRPMSLNISLPKVSRAQVSGYVVFLVALFLCYYLL